MFMVTPSPACSDRATALVRRAMTGARQGREMPMPCGWWWHSVPAAGNPVTWQRDAWRAQEALQTVQNPSVNTRLTESPQRRTGVESYFSTILDWGGRQAVGFPGSSVLEASISSPAGKLFSELAKTIPGGPGKAGQINPGFGASGAKQSRFPPYDSTPGARPQALTHARLLGAVCSWVTQRSPAAAGAVRGSTPSQSPHTCVCVVVGGGGLLACHSAVNKL